MTIYDVAREAGVSKSVVSRVVSGSGSVAPAKRAHVQEVIARLGYRTNVVARSLISGRSGTIGLLVRRCTDQFYAELMFEMQRVAAAAGWRLVTVTGNLAPGGEEQALETLLELRVDGVVIGSGLLDAEVVRRTAAQVPTVTVGRAASEADAVRVDDVGQAAQAVEVALAGGHQRVGLCSVRSHTGTGRSDVLRTALTGAGLEVIEAVGSYDFAESYRVFRSQCEALANQRPTLLIPLSYEGGLAALRVCADLGLNLPGDVSVLALEAHRGDIPEVIQLTALSHPAHLYATAAWELLLSRIDEPTLAPRERLIASRLVAGASAASGVRGH